MFFKNEFCVTIINMLYTYILFKGPYIKLPYTSNLVEHHYQKKNKQPASFCY